MLVLCTQRSQKHALTFATLPIFTSKNMTRGSGIFLKWNKLVLKQSKYIKTSSHERESLYLVSLNQHFLQMYWKFPARCFCLNFCMLLEQEFSKYCRKLQTYWWGVKAYSTKKISSIVKHQRTFHFSHFTMCFLHSQF